MIIGNIIDQKTVAGLLEKDVPGCSFISRAGNVLHAGLVFGKIFRRRMVLEYVDVLFNKFKDCCNIIQCIIQITKIILFEKNFSQLVEILRNRLIINDTILFCLPCWHATILLYVRELFLQLLPRKYRLPSLFQTCLPLSFFSERYEQDVSFFRRLKPCLS